MNCRQIMKRKSAHAHWRAVIRPIVESVVRRVMREVSVQCVAEMFRREFGASVDDARALAEQAVDEYAAAHHA